MTAGIQQPGPRQEGIIAALVAGAANAAIIENLVFYQSLDVVFWGGLALIVADLVVFIVLHPARPRMASGILCGGVAVAVLTGLVLMANPGITM